jgi:hypothetical protein
MQQRRPLAARSRIAAERGEEIVDKVGAYGSSAGAARTVLAIEKVGHESAIRKSSCLMAANECSGWIEKSPALGAWLRLDPSHPLRVANLRQCLRIRRFRAYGGKG